MKDLLRAFSWCSYIAVKNPQLWIYRWFLPLVGAALVLISIFLLPSRPNILAQGGLVSNVNSLLAVMIGLYVAALTAVSSIPNKTLDFEIQGDGATLNGEPLTRRQFLCILNGYCAGIGLVVFAMGFLSQLVVPSLPKFPLSFSLVIWNWPWTPASWTAIEAIWLSVYVSLLSSLLVATFLSMDYLIHSVPFDACNSDDV